MALQLSKLNPGDSLKSLQKIEFWVIRYTLLPFASIMLGLVISTCMNSCYFNVKKNKTRINYLVIINAVSIDLEVEWSQVRVISPGLKA